MHLPARYFRRVISECCVFVHSGPVRRRSAKMEQLCALGMRRLHYSGATAECNFRHDSDGRRAARLLWKERLVRKREPEFGEHQNYRAAGTGVFRDLGRLFVVGVPAAFLIGANAVDRRRTRLVTSS